MAQVKQNQYYCKFSENIPTKKHFQTLTPDHFYGLNALKTLSLSRMPIQSISPYSFVPLKSLRYLDMDSCNLTKIPQAVTANCHLARLNVANNMLHRSSSMPPEVMAMLSGLSQLRIEGNPLTVCFARGFIAQIISKNINHENAHLLFTGFPSLCEVEFMRFFWLILVFTGIPSLIFTHLSWKLPSPSSTSPLNNDSSRLAPRAMYSILLVNAPSKSVT